MTKSIGIRVTPKEIFYTILELREKEEIPFLFNTQKLIVPKAMSDDIPRQLSFIRTTLFSIICEYNVEFAGIRTAEGSAKTYSVFRHNIEGVIQELFADSTVKEYFSGTLTSLAARFDTKSTVVKDCVSGEKNLFNINNWNKYNSNQRESILSAIAAVNFIPNKEVTK
ncbi:hypothetical protein M1D47_12400 [Bacillus sp. R1-10]